MQTSQAVGVRQVYSRLHLGAHTSIMRVFRDTDHLNGFRPRLFA
jgi:hypothetical protein